MSKGKREMVVLASGDAVSPQVRYDAQHALDLKKQGHSLDAIAADLCLPSAWDAAQLVSMALASIQTETADQMRASSETRILDIIRRAYQDLTLCTSESQRIQLYKIILDADSRLNRLYGLALPEGLPDAPEGA